MQNSRHYSGLLFCAFVTAQSGGLSAAIAQPSSDAETRCTNVQNFGLDPITELPAPLQSRLRQAVAAGAKAIIANPGMGMQDTKLDGIPLNALKVAQLSSSASLFVVSWQDRSFGVNGFNWIVEITPSRATSLLQPWGPNLSGTSSTSGFGVEVLSQQKGGFPEMMFASNGFKVEGGAETEDSCMEKTGPFYRPVACPVACHQNLNAR
jgi:hypothetical protein